MASITAVVDAERLCLVLAHVRVHPGDALELIPLDDLVAASAPSAPAGTASSSGQRPLNEITGHGGSPSLSTVVDVGSWLREAGPSARAPGLRTRLRTATASSHASTSPEKRHPATGVAPLARGRGDGERPHAKRVISGRYAVARSVLRPSQWSALSTAISSCVWSPTLTGAMRGSKETSAEPGGHAPGLNCSAVMSVRTTSLGAKVCVRCRRVPRSTTPSATSFARKSSLGVGRNQHRHGR